MNHTKKSTVRVLLLMMILLLAVPLQVSAKVKLNKKKLTLLNGTQYQLFVKNNTKPVTWKSSKKSVVSVSADGLVTAKKRGTAVIEARVAGEKYQCKVTVKQPVTKLALSNTSLCLKKDKKFKMETTVLPKNANNRALKWSSSNNNVAKVNAKGKITAVGIGQATITAAAKDGSGLTASCIVYCTLDGEWPSVVKLDKSSMEVVAGSTARLNASGGNGTYRWTSSDPSVATVSEDGTVTPIRLGTTTVTVASSDGVSSASSLVSIVAPEPSAAAKTFLYILQKYSDELRACRAKGMMVGYSNAGALIETNWVPAVKVLNGAFDSTTKGKTAGTTYTNCALLVRWALREMGILGNGNFWGIDADGKGDGHAQCYSGIHFGSTAVRDQLLKYCQIIEVHKSPDELISSGLLIPGDICTWHGMIHTNIYAGNGTWYDAGRGPSDGDYIKRKDIPNLFSAVTEKALNKDVKNDQNNPDLSSKIYVFNSFGPVAQPDRNANGTVGFILRLLNRPY